MRIFGRVLFQQGIQGAPRHHAVGDPQIKKGDPKAVTWFYMPCQKLCQNIQISCQGLKAMCLPDDDRQL